jgi:Tol biopolymer transport system component
METYKIIKNLENYSISNWGNVKNNRTGMVLKFRDCFGYNRIRFYNKDKKQGQNIYVHRLVAEYFIPNPENKRQVNHIDGDRSNNHYTNLEWATNGENQIHRRYVLEKGIKNITLEKDGEVYFFKSLKQAADELGLCSAALSRLSNNERKSHKGYKLLKT